MYQPNRTGETQINDEAQRVPKHKIATLALPERLSALRETSEIRHNEPREQHRHPRGQFAALRPFSMAWQGVSGRVAHEFKGAGKGLFTPNAAFGDQRSLRQQRRRNGTYTPGNRD